MTLTQRLRHYLIFLAIAVAIVYLSFPTKVYYWDGIAFAQAIEDAPRLNFSLIHPNHLIYNAVGYLFYRLLHLFGADVRAVAALQILNSLLSAAVSGLLFVILNQALRSFYVSICLTLLFAFSATWWRFSTDADAYIASVLFMLVAFYLVWPGQLPRPVAVSAIFLLAILFHELAVFFGVVLALGLILQVTSTRERIIAVAKFASLTMVATCLIYGGSFYLASGRLSPFALFNWITHHSPDSDFSFNPLSNLQYVMRGHVRLFFGGRFNLLRDLMNPAILALAAVLCVAVVGFFYSVVRGIGDLRSFRPHINEWTKERRELLLLTGVWVLLYEVFLFFWLPQNTFYRLFYLPALVLLLGLLIPRTVTQRYRLAFFVVIIGLANFLFLIYPFSHVQKYPPLEFAYELNSKWPAGTVIFYAAENSDESLVRYFNPGTRWQKVDTNRTGEMERSLNEIYAGGATAWLETTAIDNLTANAIGKRWFDAHVLKDSLFELRDSAYRIQFVQVFPAN